MGYYSKFEVGYSYANHIIKKYGVTKWTPYDGTTNYNGYIFTYEPGPRTLTSEQKGYKNTQHVIRDLVWARKVTDTDMKYQLLVSFKTEKPISRYSTHDLLRWFLHGNTIGHPYFIEAHSPKQLTLQANNYNADAYQNFVRDFYTATRNHDKLYSLGRKYKNEQKANFAKLVKDNNLTKADIKKLKEEEKAKAKAILDEENNVKYLMKEMDMLSTLSIELNVLIDECKEMQKYISDSSNRLNVSHYKSRIEQVKKSTQAIRKMRIQK